MGLLDRLLGRKRDMEPGDTANGVTREDARAVERYERMLRNAPPDVIENVHIQAFEKLTPEQLDLLFERFTTNASSPEDRPANAQPRTLARAAVHAEARQVGTLTRIYNAEPKGSTNADQKGITRAEQNGITTSTLIGASILDTVVWYSIASVAFSTWAPTVTSDEAASDTSSNNLEQDATASSANTSTFDDFWDFGS